MNNIKLAFRSIGKSPRGSIIKILSLAVGLALGIVLTAKVCFEKSYDRAGKDPDRICITKENIQSKNGDKATYAQTSGGIAAAMKAEIPQVEASTKITWILDSGSEIYQLAPKGKIILEDGAILAEPNIFDLIGGKMLIGSLSSLTDKNTFLISRRV
ncbi:MAG: ABC transporter permease, partial [Bacteroidales bacterium]